MDNYGLQSYFKKTCAAFEESYNQLQRVEKEEITLLTVTEAMLEENAFKRGFWIFRVQIQAEEISEIVKTMSICGFKFIVTTRAEVLALLYYFRGNEMIDIISLDINVKESFPKEDQMCKDFYKAYILADEELMKQVIETYLPN